MSLKRWITIWICKTKLFLWRLFVVIMSRLVKKSPSVCTDLPLDNSDFCGKLHVLKELLKSAYGPSGRLKHVHNNIGGHVVTTSTSCVVLTGISSSQPLINLIKSSILNHVSRFRDCGLFAAILCLCLIDEAKLSGLRRNVSIKVNKHLLTLCTSYLQQEDCSCRVKLDFCSSQSLITLACSVISSKPACVLTKTETFHISKLAVQAFLLTVPCNSIGTVRLGRTVTLGIEGHPVMNSAVFPGLLLEVHDVFCTKMVKNLHTDPLRVVLFSASLAGDLSELGDGVIEVHTGVDTDSQILDQLLELGKHVVEDGVKLFVCQKVIHPVLQQHLRSQGVIVMERVGMALMEPLALLTGRCSGVLKHWWITLFMQRFLYRRSKMPLWKITHLIRWIKKPAHHKILRLISESAKIANLFFSPNYRHKIKMMHNIINWLYFTSLKSGFLVIYSGIIFKS